MSVKRINAFRIDDPGRGLFSTHTQKPHASLPEVNTSATTGQRMQKESASPFQNRVESVQEGLAVIPKNMRRVQIRGTCRRVNQENDVGRKVDAALTVNTG